VPAIQLAHAGRKASHHGVTGSLRDAWVNL